MWTFTGFFIFLDLENRAAPTKKTKEVLNNLGRIIKRYMTDIHIATINRTTNLHPTTGTHWVLFKKENCFDSLGFPQPKLLSDCVIEKWKMCFSEYKVQGKDRFFASSCL